MKTVHAFASALTLAAASCLRADPHHCATEDEMIHICAAGTVCSRCDAENHGCIPVEDYREPSCYLEDEGDAEDTSTASDASTSSTTSSSDDTSASASTSEDAASSSDASSSTSSETGSSAETLGGETLASCDACPTEAPACEDDTCAPCSADPSVCDQACHTTWGACVECFDEGDCGTESTCDDAYACTAECRFHRDCTSACEQATGTCMDNDPVLFVDPDPVCADEGTGTLTDPLCTVEAAIETITDFTDRRGTIVITGQDRVSEDIVIPADSVIALLSQQRTAVNPPNHGIRVSAGAVLYLGSVDVSGSRTTGVECLSGAEVWLQGTRIERNEIGIMGRDCGRISLQRAHILQNRERGLDITATTRVTQLSLEASVVACPYDDNDEAQAVHLENTEFEIVYSTIGGIPLAPTDAPYAASLNCDEAQGTIRNSIVISEAAPSITCEGAQIDTSAIDDPMLVPLGMGNKAVDWSDDYFFAPADCDLRFLNRDPNPFVDVAVWQLGDPRFDIEGDEPLRRPAPGQREIAGADPQ